MIPVLAIESIPDLMRQGMAGWKTAGAGPNYDREDR